MKNTMPMAEARECGRSNERTGTLSKGVWRLADPKISLASLSSLYLGACAAAGQGSLDYFWFTLTVLGILCIEVGKNASGEIFDFATDSAVREEDRTPFSGGKRVLVDRLLTPKQTGMIAGLGFMGGIFLGLWIAIARDPGILILGAIGVACAYFYNGKPLQLAYRGLGELSVALCYGPLIFAGTLLVQRQPLTWGLLSVSLPLGLLIAAFLWVNEFPDYVADQSAGKRNLVVRLGRARAARVFAALFAITAAFVLALPWMGAPRGAWLGLTFLIPASMAVTMVVRHPLTTSRITAAQALTLVSFLAYSAGAGSGLLHFR